MYKVLKDKISSKSAKIGVIGLGYVGLPLAVSFAEQKFEVVGIDISGFRVKSIKKGKSYIMDIPTKTVSLLAKNGFLSATSDYSVVKKLDIIIICVPTPLSKTKEPDISFIMSAIKNIIKYRRRGQLYILESTTYPGTTDEMLLPRFDDGGFKRDKDFFLSFSPERVDPRNKTYTTNNIPKVVGGITKKSTMLTKEIYGKIVEEVIPVSSSKVAEMTKLLENTFRSVNIGLVNELALMCQALDVDVWEVINAASTKPFGFMPFYPGPGIGGHCINIDPLYLSWKASLHGFRSRFIELADNINSSMPRYVANRVISALNKKGKAVKDSKILILGVSYKRDINDTRESPAFEIMRFFREEEAEVCYHDPHVPKVKFDGAVHKSAELNSDYIKKQDCLILAMDHASFDYEKIAHNAKLIFDTRNAFSHRGIESKKIIKL